MNSAAKGVIFGAALLAGAASALYLSNKQLIDSHLHTSDLQVQDWMLWFFGIALVAYCVFSFVKLGGIFDWRWPIWLIFGSTMIYAEWFNVIPLKEVTCQALYGAHQRIGWGQCYKTG